MDIYTWADIPYICGTLKERFLQGEIGILPTDTIYGISGNALDSKVVSRIQRIKGRRNPISFIPHSIDWARLLVNESQNHIFNENIYEYKGKFTTLWRYSPRWSSLPTPLCSSGLVGIRLPYHWITDFTKKLQIPLVTTSVNKHMAPYMTCLEDLPDSIKKSVDFIVYEGHLPGPPSTIVHCYKGPPFEMEKR